MIFIDACFKQLTPYTPIWMMRQAGRYLQEYKDVRKKAGSFLDLCENVELAKQVTLQPIERFDLDAAIIFSDILLLPRAMGMELDFNPSPSFSHPITTGEDLSALKSNVGSNLEFVYDIVRETRKELAKDKALIGFSGSPWTIASYMIEGGSTKDFRRAKRFIYATPALMHALLSTLTKELKTYLELQIKAGADAIMIFDSWAGVLEDEVFLQFSWRYIMEICAHLKNTYEHIPIIVFPKGIRCFASLGDGFDVLGVSSDISLSYVNQLTRGKYVLQGNLEPARLYDSTSLNEGVENIVNEMKNKPHIFNLGHGILQDTPRQNVSELIKLVRNKTSRTSN